MRPKSKLPPEMPRRKYNFDEYLILERGSSFSFKSELIEGWMRVMKIESREHFLLAVNILYGLRDRLDNKKFRTYGSYMRVAIPATGNCFYPDVTLVIGARKFHDSDKDTLLNPTLIAEVLSEKTNNYDKEVKLANYQTLSSVKEILLIWEGRIRVEHYSRQEDEWVLKAYTGMKQSISLLSVTQPLVMEEFYGATDIWSKKGGNIQ